jgi:hypothetical protein
MSVPNWDNCAVWGSWTSCWTVLDQDEQALARIVASHQARISLRWYQGIALDLIDSRGVNSCARRVVHGV